MSAQRLRVVIGIDDVDDVDGLWIEQRLEANTTLAREGLGQRSFGLLDRAGQAALVGRGKPVAQVRELVRVEMR